MYSSDQPTWCSSSANQPTHPSADSNNGIGEGDFFQNFQNEEAQVANSPISPFLVFRKYRVFGLAEGCNISGDPIDRPIDPTSGNKNLEYANGNWSTFQYFGEDKILSFGGCVVDQDNKPLPHNKILEIDLVSYLPTIVSELRSPKFSPCVASVNNVVYIFGGGKMRRDIDGFSDTYIEADEYDSAIQVISPLADMPAPKRTMNPAHYEGRIYFIGGLGSKDAFAYNIRSTDYMSLHLPFAIDHCHSVLLAIESELVVFCEKKMRVCKLSNVVPEQIELTRAKEIPEVVCIRSAVNPRELGSRVYFLSLEVRDGPRGTIWNRFVAFDKGTREMQFGKFFRICEDVNKT